MSISRLIYLSAIDNHQGNRTQKQHYDKNQLESLDINYQYDLLNQLTKIKTSVKELQFDMQSNNIGQIQYQITGDESVKATPSHQLVTHSNLLINGVVTPDVVSITINDQELSIENNEIHDELNVLEHNGKNRINLTMKDTAGRYSSETIIIEKTERISPFQYAELIEASSNGDLYLKETNEELMHVIHEGDLKASRPDWLTDVNYIDEGKNGYLYLFKIINNQTQIWLRHNNQNQYLFDLPQQRIDSVVIGPDNTIYASS